MRVVALDRHDALDFAVRVEDHLGLDRSRNRSRRAWRAPWRARGRARRDSCSCGTSARARRPPHPAGSENIGDHGIGEPRVRPHDRRDRSGNRRPRRARRSFMSHTMHSRSTCGLSEHSPFDSTSGSMGITRRGKYTELPRLSASRSSASRVFHVMADVGDRDEQAKALARAARSRPRRRSRCAVSPSIVTSGSVAHVLAARRSRRGTSAGSCARPVSAAARELVRQIVLAQRDLDFHAGIGVIAQYLDDARDRLRVACGLRDDFRHDDLPCFARRGCRRAAPAIPG